MTAAFVDALAAGDEAAATAVAMPAWTRAPIRST
jgi:hypothetical protein